MTVIIPNLAITGYRSFGEVPQYMESFAKVNVFIGQNNSGKSNILRLLHEVYPIVNEQAPFPVDPLAAHLPNKPPFQIGIGEKIDLSNPAMPLAPETTPLVAAATDELVRRKLAKLIGKLFAAKASVDNTSLCWAWLTLPDRKPKHDTWSKALKSLSDAEAESLWRFLTAMSGGTRHANWDPEIAARIPTKVKSANVVFIPAIRQIGSKGTKPDSFSGIGIIERLAKLQNPDVYSQADRDRFLAITRFLQEVTDQPDAKIEIPYERDTILIHMDGKVLPVESLGSGIHEVLILASAATVLKDHVVCMEEPELHLNPILQRKLIRYLSAETTNQYFITTHSAALMDTPGAEVYHVRLQRGKSIVDRVTTDGARSNVCADLGYHPSDLLQANCVIWVEGPSDRIYLNWWLKTQDSNLVEGIHYSIMFYGGRLAAHLTNADDDGQLESFISLRRLNRFGVMLLDSDRKEPRAHLNATKKRLQREFDAGPGHAWVTAGREIENYLDPKQVEAAIESVAPRRKSAKSFGRYDHMLALVSRSGGTAPASKVEVARFIADRFQPNMAIHDLRQQVEKIQKFIISANPKVAPFSSRSV